jgi:hypothetical protein
MKLLLTVLISVFPAFANSQQLIPFDQWERNTPKWAEDLTEVVYVAGRCASINHTLGFYISQEGNKPEDVALGKKFIAAGNTFATVALEFGGNLGMSSQFIYDRHEALTKVYVQKLAENKKMHKLVRKVQDKNFRMIQKFKEKYPDYNRASSRHSDTYNNIIIESMGGKGDNDFEKEEKIIKRISKEVFVEK